MQRNQHRLLLLLLLLLREEMGKYLTGRLQHSGWEYQRDREWNVFVFFSVDDDNLFIVAAIFLLSGVVVCRIVSVDDERLNSTSGPQ